MRIAGTRMPHLKRGAAIAALALCWSGHTEARAAGAISLATWDGAATHEAIVNVGDSASVSGAPGLQSSMAGNPLLAGSAWAHAGAWWSVHITSVPRVSIHVTAADPAQLSPGLAVWAIGNAAAFDGGTLGQGGEVSFSGQGTPNSFNAYESLGSSGTLWMQDGQGGNAKELLGYAMSGPSYVGTTGWGETITTGVHDVRVTASYASYVWGGTGSGYAELVLEDPATGWYLIYVGGTDHSQVGGLFDLVVTAESDVEVPALSAPSLVLLALLLVGSATTAVVRGRA